MHQDASRHLLNKSRPSRLARVGSVIVPMLAVVGMLISAYLTYVHFQNLEPICGELGDCEVVNASVYAKVHGIPVALIGFLAYATLLILSLLNLQSRWRYRSLTSFTVFCIAFTGVLYSAYLTYIELFVLRAICIWCVGSAITMTAILIVSTVHLFKGASPPTIK